MKFLPTLLATCAALVTTFASAQLKAPRTTATPSKPAAAQATPAAAAAVPDPARAERATAGQLAAAGWLVLLDRRDWGRAWETTSASFRSQVPLGNWMDGIPKLREDLGAFIERTPSQAVYQTAQEGGADGENVSVIFKTRFEKKVAEEILTLVPEADGKWRIAGYMTR